MNKIKMIGLLIVTMYMLTACTYNGSIDESPQTDSSVSETSNVVTLESTSVTKQNTEVKENSKTEQALEAYLLYFDENKADILLGYVEKYQISFANLYGSDIPEMVISINFLNNEFGDRTDNHIFSYENSKVISLERDCSLDDDDKIMQDADGRYVTIENYEYFGTKYFGKNGGETKEFGMGYNVIGYGPELSMALFRQYQTETAEQMWYCVSGFDEYRDEKLWQEYKNPETGLYEYYQITEQAIDLLEAMNYEGKTTLDELGIELGFVDNGYIEVSKEDYYKAYNIYMSQFKEVTDITKYTSDWIPIDDEFDSDKILDEACAVFEE